MVELSRLARTFAEDHKHLTRGLSRLLEAVRAADDAAARGLADEIDRVAGPHIEFEEEVFYPEVAKTRGREFIEGLYEEHAMGRRALEALLALPPGAPLAAAEREAITGQLKTALEHALSCGTLLSHINTRDADLETRMLARRDEIEARGRRWTELARHVD